MEESQRETPPAADVDAPMQDSVTAPTVAGSRRPRLNMSVLGLGTGERKRGKSMFGVLVNTLNKAKAEDKERNASEAAKKRHMIEQRLQAKLKKDADSVRQLEEAKKDKVLASRKEEELQLKDSIHKLRRTRLPLLSNYLLTSDVIPPPELDMASDFKLSSILPTRSHPPPLYYLPATLTPEQEAFLSKRKQLVTDAAEKEWEQFKEERGAGMEEIAVLRRKAAEVLDNQPKQENGDGDHAPLSAVDEAPLNGTGDKHAGSEAEAKDSSMEVDDGVKENDSRESQEAVEKEREKERPEGAAADEDDAVEY